LQDVRVTTPWRAADITRIDGNLWPEIPVIAAREATRVLPLIDLWDLWPVCLADGTTAEFGGSTLWMILSAPRADNPDSRHDVARIRLMLQTGTNWRDHGNLLPDGFAPGTREWAGSAVFHPATARVTLYFTATGRKDDPFSFEQRLFETSATLAVAAHSVEIGSWSPPTELFASDGDFYVDTRTTGGGPGLIKGFRDPGYFLDPANGREYILFTGSDGRSSLSHNGVIGIAERSATGWQLLPPLISGDGINNEFERPHVVVRGGFYYLFWSTQRHVFAPNGPSGPNGLYGMVADSIFGPYRPLNGTGLVAANPAAEPFQGYSWLVTGALEVVSFVDLWGMNGRTRALHPETVQTQFGGTPAPLFRLELDRETSRIV
jgi:levansucrase